MPEWYEVISAARYAGMPAPDFARLPMYWQEMYQVAQMAEIEARNAPEPETETE